MPSYDFKCEKCKKKFTLFMSISEFGKSKTRCPKCKSTRVQQQITACDAPIVLKKYPERCAPNVMLSFPWPADTA
jgi:putative FmdB family regulatory protein